jgi:hypothetical protein
MFKDNVINALKVKKSTDNNDNETIDKAANKIQKQKRLSSKEFLSVYNSLWKEGPAVKYQNPDERVRHFQLLDGS